VPAVFQVGLNDVDAALHAGLHVGVGDLDAATRAALAVAQAGWQFGIAAAEVGHAAAGRHQVGTQLQVLALDHFDTSLVMRSK